MSKFSFPHLALYTLLIAVFATSASSNVFAQTPTKAPLATTAPEDSEITPSPKPDSQTESTLKSLKEKIENTVDEINKKTKKIIKGTITSIKGSTLTVKASDEKDYQVSIDDTITKMYLSSSDGQEELEQSDLKDGDYILVTGPIIENQVSANLLYQQVQYLVLQGQITAVDKEAFTVSIVTQAKDQYTLDIETHTQQFLLNSKDLTLAKAGFSKYQVGDTVHAVIVKPEGNSEKADALRIVIIPQEIFTSETLSPSKPADKDVEATPEDN